MATNDDDIAPDDIAPADRTGNGHDHARVQGLGKKPFWLP